MRKLVALVPCLFLFVLVSVAATVAKPASQRVIAVQPFTGMPDEHVKEVGAALRNYYRCEVRVLKEVAMPEEAFTKVKTPRYRADKLLQFLKEQLPEGCDHVIGLTEKDISTTKYEDWTTRTIKKPEWKYEDWGVFGLGQMPGAACMVSTLRLKLKGGDNESKMLERLRKIACHEIGHNLGLEHCKTSEECFMRDGAESILTVDAESESLCVDCATRVGVSEQSP